MKKKKLTISDIARDSEVIAAAILNTAFNLVALDTYTTDTSDVIRNKYKANIELICGLFNTPDKDE